MIALENPQRIVIHHSGTRDGRTYTWSSFERYHVRVRGWDDIGYHAGVELVFGSYVTMYGRSLTMQGAHARGQNRDTLGFCFTGNFELDAPSTAVLEIAARRVLLPWCDLFDIDVTQVLGHRDVCDGYTCPGAAFDLAMLRRIMLEIRGRENT